MNSEAMQGSLSAVLRHPALLWLAFLLVQLWLSVLNLYAPGFPMGDVTSVYPYWVNLLFESGVIVGIDVEWVYPLLALLPLLLAALLGIELYPFTWLYLVIICHAVAFGFLVGGGRYARHAKAAWWWLIFLVSVGPIALGRIDAVTIPLAIIGGLFVVTRPRLAALLLTLGAWIKVWPGALLLSAVLTAKARWRIVVTAAAMSAAIIAVAALMGGAQNVLSFITQQTGRGLQVESPISTVWLWQALLGAPATKVYYDDEILTWQISGAGVEVVSALMTPTMVVAVLVSISLAARALRQGHGAETLFVPLSLALVASLIVTNKVGSPQFITWLAVPIILGLVQAFSRDRSWYVPAGLVLVTAALTQVIYPYLYGMLLSVQPFMVLVITARNLALVTLLAWSLIALWRLGSRLPKTSGRIEPGYWSFGAKKLAARRYQ